VDVTSRKLGAATVISVTGEVDLYSSPRMREPVVAAARQEHALVLVDLTSVSYMDSSGIATLVEALQVTKKAGGRLVLVGLTPRVREVFELARLQSIFEIAPDVDAVVGPRPGEGR